MKVKVKFDVATIKRSLIDHGEKLAFGAAVLVFLMFTWAAAKHEVLESSKQPDVLKQKASEVDGHIRQSTFNADREKVVVVDYDKRAKRDTISPEAYALARPFDPLLGDQKTKRDEPKVFPVEELQAAGGYGAFALKGDAVDGEKRADKQGAPVAQNGGFRPADGAKLEVRAFVVVTALIPIQKQIQEYARAFENTDGRDRNRDTPQYAGYRLERAEIDVDHPDKLDWKKVDKSASFVSRWENTVLDLVGAEYSEPSLTMRLGPLVTYDWNASVAHPKIPLADASNRAQAAAAAEPAKAEDAPPVPADKVDDDFVVAEPNAAAAAQAAAAPKAAASTQAAIEHRLLRVFDFTVDSKKKYRYRVKIGLANPNFGLTTRFLKNAEASSAKVLETEWSAPTEIVAVPTGYRVLAAAAPKKGLNTLGFDQPIKITPATASGDPTTRVVLTAIDSKEGIEAPLEIDALRGTVGNAVKSVDARDPRTRKLIKVPDVDFNTGFVVLDIRGARAISKKDKELLAPVEVLVLDPQGNLWVRNELEDQTLIENLKPPAEDARPSRPSALDDDKPKAKAKRSSTSTSAKR